MQQNSFSYPAMLDLKNKKCVIIGGGKRSVREAAIDRSRCGPDCNRTCG